MVERKCRMAISPAPVGSRPPPLASMGHTGKPKRRIRPPSLFPPARLGSSHVRAVLTLPPKPRPSLREFQDALAALREKAPVPVRPNDLSLRDPGFIRRVLPLLGSLYDEYFRCETEFEEELPPGRFLGVANHNAMTGIPDM